MVGNVRLSSFFGLPLVSPGLVFVVICDIILD